MNEIRKPRAQIDLVGGTWKEPRLRLGATLDDPNTGAPRQEQLATDPQEVENALGAAEALHRSGVWASVPVQTRVDLLDLVADGLVQRIDELGHEDAMATGTRSAWQR